MSQRQVQFIVASDLVIDDGDMRLWRALPVNQRESLGPFVFVDHYRHQSRRGIGDKPHPHAGIEVISYLLEGGAEHRDSLGFRDTLGPGDAQRIRAGRGMLHAEQPSGGRHGLQLWTSLPPSMKFVDPEYASIRAADIPEIDTSGACVRVIAGQVNGVTGSMQNAQPTLFAHVQLEPGAHIDLDVDAEELGLYVLEGAAEGPAGEVLIPGSLGVFGPGSRVTLKAAASQPANIALIGGAPVEGELVFAGPFVMDTPENAQRAQQDFLSGKMGQLDGVPF
ncbi:pirin family protein [Solilutibacter tolerans]|uniref:Pirin N-terminal domain-containing protein n=1 Tax=Solilutibacter tolerans TaxID=1604334 RepID=A0A1N6QGB5_9GAMM|nr:pirin family protein [Lysobacter tolerans]SIQ15552.1 hypothetical protein SAMN05421546_0692 [Lysobacter tolerans]